jgi:uncharacterized membrane protein (UPF0136 family)
MFVLVPDLIVSFKMSEVSYPHLAQNMSMIYGLFVIIGGVAGYLQAGSTTSLMAGAGAGSIAILSSIFCRKGYFNLGLKVLTAVSLTLSIVFIKRFRATGAFLPSGFMAMNSAFILFLSLMASTQLAKGATKSE